MCKFVTGALFAAGGFFHAYRVKDLWKFYPAKEKLFNIVALGGIFALSALSFNAGYEIYMGKNMIPVEMRPSYLARLTGNVQLSPQQKYEYLEKLIKLEEEKE